MGFLKPPVESVVKVLIREENTEDFIATNGSIVGKAYVEDPANVGQVVVADNTNPAHKNKFKGLATNAVSVGEMVTLRHRGELQDVSYSFTNEGGPVFYDTNGTVTDVAPTVGDHIQLLGNVLKSDRIFVNADPATAV